MKIAFYNDRKFDSEIFLKNPKSHLFRFSLLETSLNKETATLAKDHTAVCAFVNDKIDRDCLVVLKEKGCQIIALRSAGYNNVDLEAAKEMGIRIVRVPAYSPNAVAEYTVALLLDINRKIYKAHNRVREFNFSLNGLVGYNLAGKTVGIIGAGKIGKIVTKILHAFNCKILIYDIEKDSELDKLENLSYVDLDTLYKEANIISLHAPLNQDTHHIVDQAAFNKMQDACTIINTSRGGLIETKALIQALKQKKILGAALDVYEEEEGLFFNDMSDSGIDDDTLARLITFPNVLVTSHQAFLTQEALESIADTSLDSILCFSEGNEIPIDRILA